MQPFRPLMAILLLFVPIMAAGQDRPRIAPVPREEQMATTPYAESKRPSLPAKQREALTLMLPGPYPDRGVILAVHGFAGSGRWTVVNFDQRTIERLETRILVRPDGNVSADIYSKIERPLSAGEVNKIIEEANAVWRPPPDRPTSPFVPIPTDTSCAVALFDGCDVIYGYSPACPEGTEQLVDLIGGIETPAPPRR